MDIKLIFGTCASIIAIVCYIPYLKDIFKKKTQPHAYSWLIWAILQTIGSAAQLKDGAGYGAWALAIGAVLCFSVFLLSLKWGTHNITRFDGICLAASLIAIVIYLTLKNPVWAVIFVTMIDFMGYLPTFRKGWQEPFTETVILYTFSIFANLFSLIALQHYSVTTALYIGSLAITNTAFVLMITIRRRGLKQIHKSEEGKAI
jgi:uncharacterized membrane protein